MPPGQLNPKVTSALMVAGLLLAALANFGPDDLALAATIGTALVLVLWVWYLATRRGGRT